MGTASVNKLRKPKKPEKDSKRVEKTAKKDKRLQNKRQEWVAKLSQLSKARLQAEASRKAPLKHFEQIQDSLASIDLEIKAREAKKSIKPDPSPTKPLSSRGRAAVLAKEMENFRMVMSHPEFRKNPMNAIHQHLTRTLQQSNK